MVMIILLVEYTVLKLLAFDIKLLVHHCALLMR